MHKCIMVKVGKKRKLSKKCKFCGNRGEIHKFCGNKGEYATCIIGLGRMDTLAIT